MPAAQNFLARSPNDFSGYAPDHEDVFNLVTNKEKPKKRPYEAEEENVAVTSTKNVKIFFKPRELSKEKIEEQLIFHNHFLLKFFFQKYDILSSKIFLVGTRTRTSLTSQYLELELELGLKI